MKKLLSILLIVGICLALAACENSKGTEAVGAEDAAGSGPDAETGGENSFVPAGTSLSMIDPAAWKYNAEEDVYWQAEIPYCAAPADLAYETLAVFVPGAYMDAADNGDGTFTCRIDPSGTVGDFSADSAPFVLPVNTPGYSAMAPLSDYSSGAAAYTGAGFIYVHAGCRGREAGAPAGVTDLKAAIRFVRGSADNLPGDPDRFFSFGMSGGGAQSALLGATGNSGLYEPYLEAIGAVMAESDAVTGSMCWCPITNLDMADEAYEWNLGVSRDGLDSETRELSDTMAEAFALYINELGLKDGGGTALTLGPSADGIWQSGSYYDYLKTVIETSLAHFLSDTAFPYDAASDGMPGGMMGGRGGRGGPPDGLPGGGELPDDLPGGFGGGERPGDVGRGHGGFIDGSGEFQNDGIHRGGPSGGGLTMSGIYETPQDYIDALNADGPWVTYDADTETVEITSIADFARRMKTVSKSVGAFDDLEAAQGENVLFGYGDGQGAHFDAAMAEILEKLGSPYAAVYASDLARTDAMGTPVSTRVDMYNPMYYLCDYYDGAGSSSVAEFWRIRTGIEQGDTALTTEVNLALALENAGKTVDFETVWGQGHTMAERVGGSTENFISWVVDCLK